MLRHLLSNSLRKRLLVYLVCATSCVWGISAWMSYLKTKEEVSQLFDAQLAQSAGVLHAFVESMLHQGSLSEHWDATNASDLLDNHKLTHKYARRIAFQIFSIEDGLVLRSKSAPEFALSDSFYGLSNTLITGAQWHVFSVANNNGEYVIHVGQREDVRKEIIHEVARQLLWQFLLGLPFLAIIIWFTISHTLMPIEKLRKQLARREAGYLEPLPIRNLPKEIIPLVNELNALLSQLELALENERSFASDASHELRTPLAGLLLQVQVAQKTTDSKMHEQALDKAHQAVLRMTRIVQQLLTLSRLQNQTDTLAIEPVTLNYEIVEVISEVEALAHQKKVEVEFQHFATLKTTGNKQLINILIRNLIENAVKYAPVQGKVNVTLTQQDKRILLSVSDNGPGIKQEDCERLIRRFYRSVETAKSTEGSGLGLSIVKRIADLHDSEVIFLKSKLGGLQVNVLFENANPERLKLGNKKSKS